MSQKTRGLGRRRVAPRQDLERVRIGDRQHVGFLDAGEPVDRRPVEGHPVTEGVLQLGGADGEALEVAEDVGEPQPDQAHAALLDAAQHVVALLLQHLASPNHSRGRARLPICGRRPVADPLPACERSVRPRPWPLETASSSEKRRLTSGLRTLPSVLRGSSSTNRKRDGTLAAASCCLPHARRSSGSRSAPAAGTTAAHTRSPHSSSAMPTTAQSAIAGMGAVHLLDLERRHLLPAGLDDVDRRAAEQAVALRLADRHVAGAEPAVGERVGRRLGPLPVPGEHLRPAHEQLAGLAVGHVGVHRRRRCAPPCRASAHRRGPARGGRACSTGPCRARSSRSARAGRDR